MDKVLAFSILSASPADIATGLGGRWARLSWRSGAGDHADSGQHQQQQQQKRDREKKQRSSPGGKDPAASLPPRFAPEFDGIDCFETIVSH